MMRPRPGTTANSAIRSRTLAHPPRAIWQKASPAIAIPSSPGTRGWPKPRLSRPKITWVMGSTGGIGRRNNRSRCKVWRIEQSALAFDCLRISSPLTPPAAHGRTGGVIGADQHGIRRRTRHPALTHPAPGTLHLGTRHPAPSTAPGTTHQAPGTRRPTSPASLLRESLRPVRTDRNQTWRPRPGAGSNWR